MHGRSFAWGWNADHVLADRLARLFEFERNLKNELNEELSRALADLPIQRSRLFGSIARGEERSDSDIDLFLQVRSGVDKARVERSLVGVQQRIWSRFGNPVTALVYTAAEVSNPQNPGMIRSILEDGVDLQAYGGNDNVSD